MESTEIHPAPLKDFMPFKSEAQRKKFLVLVDQGKISKETFEEWEAGTTKNIPKKIGQKPRGLERKPRRVRK